MGVKDTVAVAVVVRVVVGVSRRQATRWCVDTVSTRIQWSAVERMREVVAV
jgi:hypothetical protein